MQTRRFPSVFDAEMASREREPPEAASGERGGQTTRRCCEEGEGEGSGPMPDQVLFRLPRGTRFAEGGVVTLQHWLDLNA
jgi:hypothetical protein